MEAFRWDLCESETPSGMGRFGFPSPFLGFCCHLGCEPAEPWCWPWATTLSHMVPLSHCPWLYHSVPRLYHTVPWPYHAVPQPYLTVPGCSAGFAPEGFMAARPGPSAHFGVKHGCTTLLQCVIPRKSCVKDCRGALFWGHCGFGDMGFGFWHCCELSGAVSLLEWLGAHSRLWPLAGQVGLAVV